MKDNGKKICRMVWAFTYGRILKWKGNFFKIDISWKSVWLGRDADTDENILGTSRSVLKVRNVR